MGEAKDIQTLWHIWEETVLEHGLDSDNADRLSYRIETMESSLITAEISDEDISSAMDKAHKVLDLICKKKAQAKQFSRAQPFLAWQSKAKNDVRRHIRVQYCGQRNRATD